MVVFVSSGLYAVHEFYFRNCSIGEIPESYGSSNFDGTTYALSGCSKCLSGTYALKLSSTECLSCPDYCDCPGGNIITVDAKYWRSDNESDKILQCRGASADACIGGSNADKMCAEGSTGPYCSMCAEDYTMSISGTCIECAPIILSTNDIIITATVPTIIIIIVLVVYVKKEYLKKRFKLAYHKYLELTNSQGSKIKTLFAFSQILSQLPSVLSLPSIPGATELLGYLGFVSFHFIDYTQIDCKFTFNFYQKLIGFTLFPVIILFFILIYCTIKYYIAKRLNEKNSSFTLSDARKKFSLLSLTVLFIVYSPVSKTIFEAFGCERFDDGTYLLVADYNISCDGEERESYVAYASFMLIIYPIGKNYIHTYIYIHVY